MDSEKITEAARCVLSQSVRPPQGYALHGVGAMGIEAPGKWFPSIYWGSQPGHLFSTISLYDEKFLCDSQAEAREFGLAVLDRCNA